MKNNQVLKKQKYLVNLIDEAASTAPNHRLKTLLEEVKRDLQDNCSSRDVKNIEGDVIETREKILNNLEKTINQKSNQKKSAYQIFKSFINGVIQNEYNHLAENQEDISYMESKEEFASRCSEIQNILYNHLPEEFHTLLDELDDKTGYIACLENRYYFKQGVMAGLTNLSFLNEIENVHLY